VIGTELRLDARFELACFAQSRVVIALVKILIGALEHGVEIFRRDRKPEPEACCQPDRNRNVSPFSKCHHYCFSLMVLSANGAGRSALIRASYRLRVKEFA
jgi:hypothetical protein